MPLASQTLGQITSDFFKSPFTYSVALPIEPQGTYRDVDLDDEVDEGIQIFAVAYWNNVFGDPFLEERDLSGGGWSTAYASTRIGEDAETEREIIGGKLLIFAPDDRQGFPSGFGEDGLLFTADDPIVQIPQGYAMVDLDSEPFVFDRSRHQEVDLIEPDSTALVDYSDLSYTEAFDELVDQLRDEYAFTEYKNLDWDSLHEEFRPLFVQADASRNSTAYRRALRDFSWAIPDGHVSGPQVVEDLQQNAIGSLGITLTELDDGRIVVSLVIPGSPADEAAILRGAEIHTIDNIPIGEAVDNAVAYTAPFSTPHVERIEKLRFSTRFPTGQEVELTFQNPGEETESVTLTTVVELETLFSNPFEEKISGFEQPLEYELLDDSGYGYVKLYSFSDNDLLTVQLWERLMRELNEDDTPGLIIDLRQNTGGRGFLADQMAAYFFQESITLGNTGHWDEDRGTFYFDPELEQRFYLPSVDLRYDGELVVIVGPNCASACEFFAYDLTLEDRATIVGLYPTAGLGGSISQVKMPENEFFTFTQGRAIGNEGTIHIEGIGVVPEILLPVNEANLFSEDDAILTAAVGELDRIFFGDVIEGENIAMGDSIEGFLEPGAKIRYTLDMKFGEVLSIFLESDDFDPVFALYDIDGTFLGSTEELLGASLINFEVPFDLSVIIEVLGSSDSASGNYSLRIVDNSG
jgi:C-terminal processing protease CtpA/Prc